MEDLGRKMLGRRGTWAGGCDAAGAVFTLVVTVFPLSLDSLFAFLCVGDSTVLSERDRVSVCFSFPGHCNTIWMRRPGMTHCGGMWVSHVLRAR